MRRPASMDVRAHGARACKQQGGWGGAPPMITTQNTATANTRSITDGASQWQVRIWLTRTKATDAKGQRIRCTLTQCCGGRVGILGLCAVFPKPTALVQVVCDLHVCVCACVCDCVYSCVVCGWGHELGTAGGLKGMVAMTSCDATTVTTHWCRLYATCVWVTTWQDDWAKASQHAN